jgi:hypothetical protein
MSDQFLRNVIALLGEERIPGPWAMPEEVSTDQIRAAVDDLVEMAQGFGRMKTLCEFGKVSAGATRVSEGYMRDSLATLRTLLGIDDE